ncbi:MAG: hypothetical protein NTY38_07855 [Acidobacteria bacterium]|nr:hypothetical protein [Acidobacteriota bacterium]
MPATAPVSNKIVPARRETSAAARSLIEQEFELPMLRRYYLCALPLSFAMLAIGDQSWKDKRVAEWTPEAANEVLTESPWSHKTTPEFDRSEGGRRGGGMGRMGGGGIGGIGGMGGGGMGGPRIGGGPGMGGDGGWGGGGRSGGGDGYPQGGGGNDGNYPDDRRGDDRGEPRGGGRNRVPPELTVRWESALPVQEAHLKAKDTDAPTMNEGQYAIAILGLPPRMANNQSKPKAKLERKGQKSISSSDVKVLTRDQGPIVIFFFPRSKEIGKNDPEVLFDAQMGPLKVKQTFVPGEMLYHGKLEL